MHYRKWNVTALPGKRQDAMHPRRQLVRSANISVRHVLPDLGVQTDLYQAGYVILGKGFQSNMLPAQMYGRRHLD